MTPELLRSVGETLYGEHWQPELARVLNVSPRNVRRWLSGYHAINAGIVTALAELCERQGRELTALAPLLRAEARVLRDAAAVEGTAAVTARVREEWRSYATSVSRST